MKKLLIFDLDGTLAESKAAIDTEMADHLTALLEVAHVAIISGGDWPQFKKQVLDHLPKKNLQQKLSILPTCGTKFYQYDKEWKQLYAENFTAEEKEKIIKNLNDAISEAGWKITKTWGEQIEDRGSQVTFSALGQSAPLKEKKDWDPDFSKRKKVQTILNKSLSEFSVTLGGTTSIDVTKPGIDKAYGIQKLKEVLEIEISEMMFVGDALFKGGNDYPSRKTGVICVQVRDPEETKRVIETFVACLNDSYKGKEI
ncbi:HAD-IIB family hydrolase [Pedobacter changchengzhani]|uniref:phosphomannomutase n=1 Tax=Pedobacter changchengzhani TaxID=2529274 RepID=A0A4R5MJJ7_9SPHI|nr:HAD-IIB family hydrolase [Pedobacter changchengzhani]TDG35566.1 HAD-IIB family hydrolase [Pedobacter changchengzhani]